MKKLVVIIFGIIIGLTVSYDTYASHLAGGSIRYDYVGPTPGSTTSWRYKITVFAFRYCGSGNTATYGCGANGEQVYARCSQTGAQLGPIRLTAVPYVPKPGDRPNPRQARDVSDVCSTRQTGCEVRGGVNGYELFVWEGTVDLPRCNSWRFTYKSCTCCRNGVQNFTGGSNTGLETFINTAWSPRTNPGGAPANSAPQFADEAKPFPSVCVGQDVFYGIGTYDGDGDSLRFIPVCPWATTGTGGLPNLQRMNPRGTGVSCTRALPGLVMDPATGLISFRPATTGSFIVAFYVEEYERCTGILKGKTYREVQFQVASCTNKVPVDKSGISNITGRATLLSSYKMEVCNGDLISWEDTLFDPDRGDTLKVLTNLNRIMPNAKMDIISIGQRNSIVVRFTWRAVMGADPIKSFFITFTDDKCNIPGSGFSVFELDVKPSAALDPDQYVCKGDTAFLTGYGSNTFEWTSLYGDPLLPGVNWFPDTNNGVDTNKFVKFLPSQTSALAIRVPNVRGLCGEVVQNCFVRDTIKIYVPESYQITMPNDTVICNPATGPLDVTTSKSNLKYTYKWSPSRTLNNDAMKNPTFSNVLKNTNYKVTVTSDSGCVREGSMQVDVTNPFPQNMRAMATDTLICLQDTIGMWVNTGSINYGSCDTSIYPCLGSSQDKIFGSGSIRSSNGQANVPAIYASRNRSLRAQFLYTAADLKARGIGAGPITSIGFNIFQMGFQGANPFNGFTIKMGCTSSTKMATAFAGGLKVVSDPKAHVPVVGWNTHVFDRDYVWDGVSNLLVEICWDNGPNRYAWDHLMTFDATTYASSIRYYSTTANAACNAAIPTGAAMFILPRTKFGVCSGINTSNYRFQWLPDPVTSNGGFLAATNTDSTSASVNLTTAGNYKAFVSDTSGVCFDTLDLKINVVSKYQVKPDSLGEQCLTSGIIRLTSPTPYNISNPGGKWTGTGIINDSLGLWNPLISGAGSFPVTFNVSGDACANSGTTTLNIVGLPDLSLVTPDSACSLYQLDSSNADQQELTGLYTNTPGAKWYFTGLSANGVDSVENPKGSGNWRYYINGPSFNPTVGNPDTARIRYRAFKGCWHDTIIKIPVVAPFDPTYLGVMSNGLPIFTTEFCSTSKSDTLGSVGKGGSWMAYRTADMQNDRTPVPGVIDTARGVFNPTLVNNGSGGPVYVEVKRRGFCGDSARYRVNVLLAPEVRVLAENFCFKSPGDCIDSEIPANERKRTIKVRVATSGTKRIDDQDPSTYADVITADKTNTGLGNVIESDKITKWDGNPWMIFPYKCEYPFCQLTEGRYPISYTMATAYRKGTNHPDSICAFTHDTAIFISKTPEAPIASDGDYRICLGDSLPELRYEDFAGNLTLEWYNDDFEQDGANAISKGNPIGADTSFAGFIPETDGELYARLRDPAGCLGRATPISYSVFGYPEVSFTSESDTIRAKSGEQTKYTNTTQYDLLPITYAWSVVGLTSLFPDEPVSVDPLTNLILGSDLEWMSNSGTVNSADAWHEITNGEFSPLSFEIDEFGMRLVTLYGKNEIGCADTTSRLLYIDQIIDPKFPNVFTPNGDGINDWWSAISPIENGDYNEELLRKAYKEQFTEIEGYIYDRWGRKVIELTIDDPFWKGDNKAGNDQPDGIYMYIIELKSRSASNEVFKEQGTITLIRGK